MAGLQKTTKSIITQRFQSYEWIIIDGGSNDGTLEHLEKLQTNYISEADNGIYDAMNKGIRRATGHYILFINAGDALENENVLHEISLRAGKEDFDFIYGDSVEQIEDKKHFKRARPHHKIKTGMFTHHQAMIYNLKLLQDFTYDTNYMISADYDLTWRVINKSENFLYLPFPICIFEAGGLSQRHVTIGRLEQFKIRKAHKVSLLRNSFIFAVQTLIYNIRKYLPKFYWFLKR